MKRGRGDAGTRWRDLKIFSYQKVVNAGKEVLTPKNTTTTLWNIYVNFYITTKPLQLRRELILHLAWIIKFNFNINKVLF